MYNTQTASMVKSSNHTQKDTTVNTVMKTNDYSKFTKIVGNRNLNRLHSKRLKASIEECDLLFANPILVNDKYEIIDGQHRYEICVELKKPIYYIQCEGLNLNEIQILNANSKNWKSEDYINGYCDLNLPEYIWLRSFCNRYSLSAEIGAIISNGASNNSECIKNGKFAAKNKMKAEQMASDLNNYFEYYAGAYRRRFVEAVVSLDKIKGFSHEKMIAKLKYQSTKLVDCTNSKSYVALLEEIYNYKERGQKLRFF
jgi:hypothetical protein